MPDIPYDLGDPADYVKPDRTPGRFSEEKRLEVVAMYYACGNARETAENTGVGYATILHWRRLPWWKEAEQELKTSKRLKTDNKLSGIIDKSLILIEDRILNGDLKLIKKVNPDTKEITYIIERTPLALLTINKLANDLMQRQIDIDKIKVVENQTQQQDTIKDQLKLLAHEFAKFNGVKPKLSIVQGEDHSIHEERPEDWEVSEGLPQRGGPIHQQAFGSEEEDGTEQSSEDYGGQGFDPQR